MSAVEEHLRDVRSSYSRLSPDDLCDRVAAGALLVDTRPVEQRDRDGELPGALVVDRNVLEWRVDPTSAHRVPEATQDRDVVLVCDQGYSTSLAVGTLRTLGMTRVTDLAEGFQGLLARGLLEPLAAVTTTPGRHVS